MQINCGPIFAYAKSWRKRSIRLMIPANVKVEQAALYGEPLALRFNRLLTAYRIPQSRLAGDRAQRADAQPAGQRAAGQDQ